MRLPKIIFFILLTFSLRAQDSVAKKGIRLFDIQFSIGPGANEFNPTSAEQIKFFTKHSEFSQEAFTRDYSESPYRGAHPSIGGFAELGLNTTFQFTNYKSKFLKRLKPRLGGYLRDQTVLDYKLQYSKKYALDTLYFVNPDYPPVYVDSSVYGEINYTYKTKRIFIEAGANFDVVIKKKIILYAGLIVGYGLGYDNNFRVQKIEHSEVSISNGRTYELVTLDQTFKEDATSTFRLGVPIGLQLRFASFHRLCPGLFAELRPGFSSLKTKQGLSFLHDYISVKLGLRFCFQYNK